MIVAFRGLAAIHEISVHDDNGYSTFDFHVVRARIQIKSMPIPLSRLNTWANQGGTGTSTAAYNSIRTALLKSTSPLANRGVEIFLQGSYANSTNIHADSDIDVVVLYDKTYCSDVSALTPAEQQLHRQGFVPAAYLWSQLRDDALAALRSHYGYNRATPGRKSIKVETGMGRKTSDIVPAIGFHRYATFVNQSNCTGHWGIQFYDSSNNPIVNYPKYHIDRGEDKNQQARTRGQYKATIRLFKNFRNHLIDNRLLADGVAPSYFIECALYNVPDNLFIGNFAQTVPTIIHHLLHTPYAGLLCQNGVVSLIGSGPTQWSVNNLATFLAATQNAWNNWR